MTTVATTTERPTGALALSGAQQDWSPKQLAALAQLGLDDVPPADLAVFLHQSQRTGLDPFARQIYMIGRWDKRSGRQKYTIQAAIDGLRIVAERHGQYGGQEGPFYCGQDGKWVDVWVSDKPPVAARVGVVRKDWTKTSFAVAKFSEYAATNREGKLEPMWANKPCVMIAKCLPYHAQITTDRGTLKIGEIVNKRLPVRVRSIDLATGEEVWKPVVNWWRNGSTNQWIRIWAPNGTRGNRCIRITADHPIWTPTGWRKAGELSVGDQIAVTSPTLTDDQVQIINGGLLGDGHLGGSTPGNSLPHYAETHSIAQADYLRWKASALSNLNVSLDEAVQSDGAGGTHKVLRMRTAASPILRQFREMPPIDRLSNLSDLGVAVWLMDDGSIKRTGPSTANPYTRIYCCGFSVQFAEAAVEFFGSRYGVTAKVCRPEKNPYLRIGTTDTVKLLAHLSPWLRYDEESNDKQWVGGVVDQGSAAGMTFVPISRMEVRTCGEPEGRYDIEVESTHTFVYNNIVVSNCAEALALRKAFPHDLSGIYTSDEMAQADAPETRVVVDQAPNDEPVAVDWDARIAECGADRERLLSLWKSAPAGDVRAKIKAAAEKAGVAKPPEKPAEAEPEVVDAEIVEDEPVTARGRLDKLVRDSSWDKDIVADLFAAQYKTDLDEATSERIIDEFRKSLFALSDEDLKATTKAAS